jgi:hypothetical protein
MSEHRIAITLSDDAATPVPANQTLRVGDTVVYFTDPPNLPFRVEFAASPFAHEPHVITDSTPRRALHEGMFTCKCFITPENGKEVGWHLNAPKSGGEHDIRPKSGDV